MDIGDENIQIICVLGQGTFGRVFQCKSLKNGKYSSVCVKRIIVRNMQSEIKMVMEEVYILSQLKHPNIVKFLKTFVHFGAINIVMEYAEKGTLRDVINRIKLTRLPKTILMKYFCDILMGLEYIHMRHVIHRDLKPENLLIDNNNQIKITDFGISSIYVSCIQNSNALGTPFYMAPESLVRDDQFDYKTDIWAFGCILYEMCTGNNPFQQATDHQSLLHLICVRCQPMYNCEAVVPNYGIVWSHMCEKMLTFDHLKRISTPEIFRLNSSITIPLYLKYFR